VNFCPWEGRQTLFFSATMPPAIQTFAQWCLTDPVSVEIARRAVASTVTHAFYPVAMDQRDELLLALLKQTDYHSVMIFTRTRKEADQVCAMIKASGQPKVAAMHSDISQVDRMKALAGFKSGDYEVLVATDVAARGIDISGVSHVINYRVPENAEDYVHRIGRTGRAEAEGDAFTILTADELDFAKSVEVFIDQKIERRKLEDFPYSYTALLDDSPSKPIRRKSTGGKKKRR
jgi:ATP-dependent RNA helicase RhlE